MGGIVRSHIGSKRPEPGPYKCMLTLTSKTCFGAIRGCQEQTRERDLVEAREWMDWEAQSEQYFTSEVGCYNMSQYRLACKPDDYEHKIEITQ